MNHRHGSRGGNWIPVVLMNSQLNTTGVHSFGISRYGLRTLLKVNEWKRRVTCRLWNGMRPCPLSLVALRESRVLSCSNTTQRQDVNCLLCLSLTHFSVCLPATLDSEPPTPGQWQAKQKRVFDTRADRRDQQRPPDLALSLNPADPPLTSLSRFQFLHI